MPENEEKKEKCTLKQFERNGYFYGKIMTVKDFELEQEYFNGKRHLLNRLVHGKGLLCGFSLSQLEITQGSGEFWVRFMEGGVALDSMGREIIVPKGTKKKVFFEDRETSKKLIPETTYLYLRYSPADYELVIAASNSLSSEEITYPNRILEDFKVIASFEYPVEKENESKSVSCTALAETDEKVFFAAVNNNLSINEEESSRRQYLAQRAEVATMNSATGVVQFNDPTENSVSSDFIDPKLGKSPISIQLGQEIDDKLILTGDAEAGSENGYPKILTGDAEAGGKNGSPKVQLGAVLDPSGKFKVQVVFEDESERRTVRIRWWAFKAGIN